MRKDSNTSAFRCFIKPVTSGRSKAHSAVSTPARMGTGRVRPDARRRFTTATGASWGTSTESESEDSIRTSVVAVMGTGK